MTHLSFPAKVESKRKRKYFVNGRKSHPTLNQIKPKGCLLSLTSIFWGGLLFGNSVKHASRHFRETSGDTKTFLTLAILIGDFESWSTNRKLSSKSSFPKSQEM